ncbi:hypothetical protein X474_04525 [Dethiosulfatarculus sandiegensis]|uniref:Uncharacterized protein n=1 Tax=Dethiosulfatarculus sandiegensis TaxID=1429043 RepID=A0A0D2JIJ6_9BACT|nr:hypothetical protein X474_04525 [Dethiosulfatarculus sandiegensis]
MTSSQPEYNLLSAWPDLAQDLRPGVEIFSPPANGPKSRIALFACLPPLVRGLSGHIPGSGESGA